MFKGYTLEQKSDSQLIRFGKDLAASKSHSEKGQTRKDGETKDIDPIRFKKTLTNQKEHVDRTCLKLKN